MSKFPVDAPNRKVVKTLESLGFSLVREGNHNCYATEEFRWNIDSADHTQPPCDQELDLENDPNAGRHLQK